MNARPGGARAGRAQQSAVDPRRDLRGLIPREHGSWAYLLIPEIAAVIAAPRAGAALVWAIAATLFFCAFQAFAAAKRRRGGFSPSGAFAAAAGLLVIAIPARAYPPALLTLIPSAAPVLLGLLRTRGRIGHDDAIEVLGIVATSIMGGGALLAGGGSVLEALLLVVASGVYSMLSLIWVRVRLTRELPGRHALLPPGWNIPASLALLIAAAGVGFLSGHPAAGLLPGIYCVRVLLPVPRRPDGKVRLTGLGAQEGVVAGVFATGLGLFIGL